MNRLTKRVALAYLKEVGDCDSPLEVNLPEDVVRDHPDVGKKARVAPYAMESLYPLRNKEVKVTGVIHKNSQLAAYEVEFGGKTLYGPKASFFVDQRFAEDTHLNSPLAMSVKNALHHWLTPRSYRLDCWDGLESMYCALAKVVDRVDIEVAEPVAFRLDSKQYSMKSWRLVIEDGYRHVVVHCTGYIHDAHWTLSVVVYSTNDLRAHNRSDMPFQPYWLRVMRWMERTVLLMTRYEEDSRGMLEAIQRRKKWNHLASKCYQRILPALKEAYWKTCGQQPTCPRVSIGFSNVNVPGRAAATHSSPSDLRDYSIITLGSHIMGRPKYMVEVIKHELIHLLLRKHKKQDPHDEMFQQMAKLVGLPDKYRD